MIQKACVLGAGSMGHGIAQILAAAGIDVTLFDIGEDLLKKGIDQIKWSLEKFVEKRQIRKEDAESALSRIKPVLSLEEAVKDVDIVIEAIPENMELKKDTFRKVDKLAPEHTILATNTSALSVTEMSDATGRPNKFVGMHFFNPAQLMMLVEVIRGDHTDDETTQAAVELSERLGKKPVVVKKDVRGFIVNRVLGFLFNEAFWALHRGEATKEEVDAALKYKAGFPMGAFELADYVGLDVLDDVTETMVEAYGKRADPSPIVGSLVKEGKLGRKTKQGFFDWSKGRPMIPFELAEEYDVDRIYAVVVNEAAELVQKDVASPEDIDTAMKFGTGWPSGPCELGDRIGLDMALNKLQELYQKYGQEMYKPCPLLEEYVNKGWLGRKAKRGFYEYE